MQELINKIMDNAGLTAEQTLRTLETIKDYVKEQYPMMAGAVDKLFESPGTGDNPKSMHADVDDY